MIKLTDERGFISDPKSWDEIKSLPGYQNGIDPADYDIKSVIGSYHLKDIHCGLSCNQPHDKGYIVLTKQGVVTNLGNVCGKNHYGLDFIFHRNQHHKDLERQNNKDLIYTFSFQVDELEASLLSLRSAELGVDWMYKTSQALKVRGKGCPDQIVSKINTMVKTRSNSLEKEREATDQEVEALGATQTRPIQKPYYITDKIAVIQGLDLLAEEHDLRRLVIIELLEKIKVFKKLDIEELSFSELSDWAKWVNTIERLKAKVIFSLNTGLKLLNESNLQAFREILSDAKDLQLFNKFLKGLPKDVIKVEFDL